MPAEDFSAAIAALERRLAEHERKGAELKSVINALYAEAGLAPKFSGLDSGSGGSEGAVLTQLKRDSFYGKKQMTAIRELLEMRRAQGNGPATPKEIMQALVMGGYRFKTKSDDIAMVGLRALLRKSTTVFHKLPGTGTYGLLAWYPGAKSSDASDDEDGPSKKSKVKAKGKVARNAKRKRASGGLARLPAPTKPEGEEDEMLK